MPSAETDMDEGWDKMLQEIVGSTSKFSQNREPKDPNHLTTTKFLKRCGIGGTCTLPETVAGLAKPAERGHLRDA